jgi:hypothetical protein
MKHPYKIQFKRFLVLLFVSVFINLALAKNYYVSKSGSSSNAGTSINKAFDSINNAISIAEPGDTIFVLPGTYAELITINGKNGAPDKPICILGYSDDSANYPIIDGQSPEPSGNGWDDWIHMDSSSWIVIAKMEFVRGWTYPIQITNSSYISFDSCKFLGGRRVINAGGAETHHILVENCYWNQGGKYLWTLVKDRLGVNGWLSMHHGITSFYNGSLIDFHGTGGSIVIRHNTLIDAYNAIRWRGVKGYDSNIEIYDNYISQMRDNDFEPEYYTFNLYIYHNFSHNIHRTLSVDHDDGGNIYYYGNIITTDNNPWVDKVCAGFGKIYGDGRHLSYPLYIFNNSFYGVSNAYRIDDGKAILVKHYNNAYYFSGDSGWVLNVWDTTDAFDYDVSNKKWAPNMIKYHQEQHGKMADAMYVNPKAGNLRLQSSSPAIDAGKVMSFKDLGWTQSYVGKAPDIGAYDNGKLVEGPPFRFIPPPGAVLSYKEKPRIVRDYINGNNLILYFSEALDPITVKKDSIILYSNNVKVRISKVSLGDDNYSLSITTGKDLSGSTPSISFEPLPYGINGQQATYWASTIKIHKQ